MILLNGKQLSEDILSDLRPRIRNLKLKEIKPTLCIIQVGNRKDSLLYIAKKKEKCDKLTILYSVHHLDESCSEMQIINIIQNANKTNCIHGILVQLPLPQHLNKHTILNTIDPLKDIDGFHFHNTGKLVLNQGNYLSPCTPRACMQLLESYRINLQGKHAVIIGCSNVVGLPLSILLLQKNATVTICHIHTKNSKQITQQADIIISCCGVPHLVQEDWIKENTIIIDCGINTKNNKLVGDVDFENVKHKCSHITPVPGGVGPMTIAILLTQLIEICERLI